MGLSAKGFHVLGLSVVSWDDGNAGVLHDLLARALASHLSNGAGRRTNKHDFLRRFSIVGVVIVSETKGGKGKERESLEDHCLSDRALKSLRSRTGNHNRNG